MARNRRRVDRSESARRLKSAGGRVLRVLAIASGVFAGLTGVGYGGLTAYTWLTHSPRFGISSIAVEGSQRASNEELIRLSGLQLGQNIFKADLSSAAQQVATERWVKTASVERKSTTDVRIRVEERQPSVLVDLGNLYIADTEGQIFKRVDRDRLDLPVVSGITRQSYEQDPDGTRDALLEAEKLADDYRTRGLEADGPLEEISIDPDRALSLVVAGGAQTILLGVAPFEEKLERLRTIRAELKKRGVAAEVIHLESQARPNWVAVKLAPAVADASHPRVPAQARRN
jgi:cell division protein FtsQ